MSKDASNDEAGSLSGLNQCISLLMRRHDVDERSQAALIARIIGASPLQVRRRLAGTSGNWLFEEILALASHFGESISAMLTFGGVDQKPKGVRGVLEINGAQLKCQAWLGPPVDRNWTRLCAMQLEDSSWQVGTQSYLHRLRSSATYYAVDRLEYIDDSISSVRVAIIDDDSTLAFSLQDYLEQLGYQAKAFTTEESVLPEAMSFHAFIVDYALANKRTSLTLVRQIRQLHPDAPILLLTGRIRSVSPEQRDDDIMTLTRVLNVQIYYKPADSALLANAIQGELRKARLRNSPIG